MVKGYLNSNADKIVSKLDLPYSVITSFLQYNSIDDISIILGKSFMAFNDNKTNKVNYCSKITDSKFQRFLNYSTVLSKLKEKYENKIVKTGNFVRKRIFSFDLEASRKDFDIKSKKPILLILGGSTGSVFINNFVKNNLVVTNKNSKLNIGTFIHEATHKLVYELFYTASNPYSIFLPFQ